MMVPRSYHYQASSASLLSLGKEEMSLLERHKSKSSLDSQTQIKPANDRASSKPQMMLSVSAATPSKPVVIPTRTKSARLRRPTVISRSSSNENSEQHDPNSIPPSMAALLAITNISNPKAQSMRLKGFGRRKEIENFSADDYRYSLSSSSPQSWSVLQSPPEPESDIEDCSFDVDTDRSSITSRSTVAPLSSLRSLSYDSIRSLDMDLEFDSSYSSSPPNASNRSKPRLRKDKRPSPAVQLASDGDHPLSQIPVPDDNGSTSTLAPITEHPKSEPLFLAANNVSTSSFKSNLTASLRLLKSAAKSLSAPSHFHNPASLSPKVKALTLHSPAESVPSKGSSVEEECFNSLGVRLPANIDALPFYLSSQLPEPRVKASIQLQPCFTSPLSTPSATAPPIFLPATETNLYNEDPGPRERQQRENSNFLRMVVLEMNMRRAGKLNGDGRARIWLGARSEKASQNQDMMSQRGQGVADGVKASGKIFLDGEIGEVDKMEHQEDKGQGHGKMGRMARDGIRRQDRNLPARWVAMNIE